MVWHARCVCCEETIEMASVVNAETAGRTSQAIATISPIESSIGFEHVNFDDADVRARRRDSASKKD